MTVARSSGVAVVRRTSSVVVGDVLAEPAQHLDRVVLQRPDVVQRLERGASLGDPRGVGGPLGDHGRGPGVAQDPLDLLGRRGLVDRHGDRAGEPDRVVDEGPLVAGLGDQGDPVAGLDAGGDQALGDRAHLVEELSGGDVLPARRRVGARRRRASGASAALRHDVVGQVPRRGDLDGQRGGVLTHGASSSGDPGGTGCPGEVTAGRSEGRSDRLAARSVTPHRLRRRGPVPTRARGGHDGRPDHVVDRHRRLAQRGDGRDRGLPGVPHLGQGRDHRRRRLRAPRRPRREGLLQARRLADQGRVHPGLRLVRRRPGHLDPRRGQDAARRSTGPTCSPTSATARPT